MNFNYLIHIASYEISNPQSLPIEKPSDEIKAKLDILQDCKKISYHQQPNSSTYLINFNNYSGFFNDGTKDILIIHKKIADLLACNRCNGQNSNKQNKCSKRNQVTFECDILCKTYIDFYEKFITEIIEELFDYLPFSIISVTNIPVSEHVFNENPLFKLLILLAKKDEIVSAVNQVLSCPNRHLQRFDTVKRVDEATYIDGDVVLDILYHPHRLYQHPQGFITSHGKKYAVYELLQYEFVETFDTPENRFVKHFLRHLLDAIDECITYLEKNKTNQYPTITQSLLYLKNEIDMALSSWVFADVGNLSIFPSNSQVLMKQAGYRELFQLSRLLRCSFVPNIIGNNAINEAFGLKSMDVLWEFKTLLEIINSVKSMDYTVRVKEWETKQEEKTKEEYEYACIVFNNDTKEAHIRYQDTIPVGMQGKYLRPDFLLECDDVRLVIDAKFMFKENVPTGDLIKYLTSKRRDGGKLSHTVICACIGDGSDLNAKVLSFTNMFNDYKHILKDDLNLSKLLNDFLLNPKQKPSDLNQYIGYVQIQLK